MNIIDMSELDPEIVARTKEMMPILIEQQYAEPLKSLVVFLITGGIAFLLMWTGSGIAREGDDDDQVIVAAGLLLGLIAIISLVSMSLELIDLVSPE